MSVCSFSKTTAVWCDRFLTVKTKRTLTVNFYPFQISARDIQPPKRGAAVVPDALLLTSGADVADV